MKALPIAARSVARVATANAARTATVFEVDAPIAVGTVSVRERAASPRHAVVAASHVRCTSYARTLSRCALPSSGDTVSAG
jgi:hypothetical protein